MAANVLLSTLGFGKELEEKPTRTPNSSKSISERKRHSWNEILKLHFVSSHKPRFGQRVCQNLNKSARFKSETTIELAKNAQKRSTCLRGIQEKVIDFKSIKIIFYQLNTDEIRLTKLRRTLVRFERRTWGRNILQVHESRSV